MATGMTRSVPLSPASSIASLPASDDVSDFSDSDFDIISSSDSTRSHEDDVRRALDGVGATGAHGHYSDDDETYDQSIEPELLLDREWYGMIDPQRVRPSPLPVAAETSAAGSDAPPNPPALSDEDVNVIDALSQSLERSNESIRASATPISASVANVHFITSPTNSVRLRRASSPLSRSRQQLHERQYTSSPSSEVLQLAFPDPLSTSESSLTSQAGLAIPASPIVDSLPETLVNNESVSPKAADTSFTPLNTTSEPIVAEAESEPAKLDVSGAILIPDNNEDDIKSLATPQTDITLVEVAHEDSEGDADEKTDVDNSDVDHIIPPATGVPSRAYRPFFDAFDDYLAIIIKHLSATVAGNRWTASVIVSVLALIIGGITYIGAPSTPSPTPSLLVPSSTSLWGMLYPVNKSSVLAQPSPALTSNSATEADDDSALSSSGAGGLRDMSLSLFAPWALSVSPSPSDMNMNHMPGPRGIKRKRGGSSQTPSRRKEQAGGSEVTEPQPTPALGIDPPHLNGAKAAFASAGKSARSASSSRSVAIGEHILSLPDTRVLATAIKEYLYPAASLAYDALSEDLAVLMRALDELLAAIQTQTAQISSVLGRTKGEASYRHSRAKENARRLKRKGGEVFSTLSAASQRSRTRAKVQAEGFKRTVAIAVAHGERLAVDPAGTIKDIAKGVRQDVMVVAEGVREGFRQGLKIRKTHRAELYEATFGAFGSSGGDRSDLEKRRPTGADKKKSGVLPDSWSPLSRKERMTERKESRRLARLAKKQGQEDGKDTGFLSRQRWARQQQATNPSGGPCPTCGHATRRNRAEMTP